MMSKSSSVGSRNSPKAFFASMRMALFDQVPEVSPVGVNQTRATWNPVQAFFDALDLNLRVSRRDDGGHLAELSGFLDSTQTRA